MPHLHRIVPHLLSWGFVCALGASADTLLIAGDRPFEGPRIVVDRPGSALMLGPSSDRVQGVTSQSGPLLPHVFDQPDAARKPIIIAGNPRTPPTEPSFGLQIVPRGNHHGRLAAPCESHSHSWRRSPAVILPQIYPDVWTPLGYDAVPDPATLSGQIETGPQIIPLPRSRSRATYQVVPVDPRPPQVEILPPPSRPEYIELPPPPPQ